jgi:predicted nucleotidyltransferase
METESREICAGYAWVGEVWLFGSAREREGPLGDADLLVVCDWLPRTVEPGQRKRLLSQLEVAVGRSLSLRLTTAEQLSKWRAPGSRFATAFNHATRLYP